MAFAVVSEPGCQKHSAGIINSCARLQDALGSSRLIGLSRHLPGQLGDQSRNFPGVSSPLSILLSTG